MRIINSLLILLALCFCLSCSKDDQGDPLGVNVDECLGEVESIAFLQNCDTLAELYSENVCEMKNLNDHHLSSMAKSYAMLYCSNIAERYLYTTESGKYIELFLTDKNFRQTNSVHFTNYMCDPDSLRRIAYCVSTELINMELSSSDNSLQFKISISAYPDIRYPDDPGVGDRMSILRKSAGMPLYFFEFNSLIDPGSIEDPEIYEADFLESLELNGDLFEDVYTDAYSPIFNNLFKYYINKEFGLVGFIDSDGELYTIKAN